MSRHANIVISILIFILFIVMFNGIFNDGSEYQGIINIIALALILLLAIFSYFKNRSR